jgi:cytochrome c-type biogenesis protein CcmH/NrfF
VVVNPLVNWIWFGFGILASARSSRCCRRADLRVRHGEGAGRRGHHVESPQFMPAVPRTALERELGRELICMCGTCGRQLAGECQCGYAARMRAEIAKLVAEGKDKDEVFAYYIAKYGSQEPLAAPIDAGFNRLAWFVPYLAGGAGAMAVGLMALRWSRRSPAETGEPAEALTAVDPILEGKLDDELGNLD